MVARRWYFCLVLMLSPGVPGALVAAPPSTAPVEGLRENTPAVHALTGVRLIPEPGREVANATIVIRDGVIEMAGQNVEPPADARIWDLSGRTVYPGLIDAYSEQNITANPRTQGSPHWNVQVTPHFEVADYYSVAASLNEKLRGQGITVRLVAPGTRIIKGQSAIVTTGTTDTTRAILKRGVAQHFRLTVARGGSRDQYPNSPMGAVALARQTLLDADWYDKAWAAWRGNNSLPRPERNDALEALGGVLDGSQQAIIDAPNEQFALRADRFAREFGLKAILRGSGREYRRLEEIKATGRAVIVPVNFPQPPAVGTLEDAHTVTLEQLMHWDHAPENPARLEAAGVTMALTSHGLRDLSTFLAAVRRAVERGLSPQAALKALTTTPASLLGIADRHGRIAPGMAANLVVTDGDLFAKKTKVIETWVDGNRFEVEKAPELDPRGTWDLESAGDDGRVLKLQLQIAGSANKLSGTIARTEGDDEREKVKLADVSASEGQLRFRFEGKSFGKEGPARASATVSLAEPQKPALLGTIVWGDGSSERLTGARSTGPKAEGKEADEKESHKSEAEETEAGDSEDKQASDDKDVKKRGDEKKPEPRSSFAANYPLGDYGREKLPERPEVVAVTGATLWTCGPAGIVEGATLLVRDGKIFAAGKDIEIPEGSIVIDAQGKHVTPGIIDCHSHMATDGGVNESSQAITAEVRIADFIDANDITVYRQLAGGVTAANILHGSANPIGGQNQVIKLRWGASGEAMKFEAAPPGIKFALGENVKQSNWGDRYTTRYPQSRMGVEQIIRDAFHAARDYQAAHDRWNTSREGLPPRRDLELEALAEIVNKKRWIHCHSYRQDEILALIRVCDDFGITIGSLQHILEGYKVADAMAKHGATGSSFSDWWAYKIEVYDAIPFNGALMHRAGIIVSFNSDDGELGRHLNHEAAKAVKYGGVPREEALKFVTLNPAKQLRIDSWVGSLEEGKHADFVIWSGDPLSPRSVCEQTWIDGRKYFDREADIALRAEQAKMRAALIRKILDSGESTLKPGEQEPEEWELWPRHDEFCHHGHGHDEHAHDGQGHDGH